MSQKKKGATINILELQKQHGTNSIVDRLPQYSSGIDEPSRDDADYSDAPWRSDARGAADKFGSSRRGGPTEEEIEDDMCWRSRHPPADSRDSGRSGFGMRRDNEMDFADLRKPRAADSERKMGDDDADFSNVRSLPRERLTDRDGGRSMGLGFNRGGRRPGDRDMDEQFGSLRGSRPTVSSRGTDNALKGRMGGSGGMGGGGMRSDNRGEGDREWRTVTAVASGPVPEHLQRIRDKRAALAAGKQTSSETVLPTNTSTERDTTPDDNKERVIGTQAATAKRCEDVEPTNAPAAKQIDVVEVSTANETTPLRSAVASVPPKPDGADGSVPPDSVSATATASSSIDHASMSSKPIAAHTDPEATQDTKPSGNKYIPPKLRARLAAEAEMQKDGPQSGMSEKASEVGSISQRPKATTVSKEFSTEGKEESPQATSQAEGESKSDECAVKRAYRQKKWELEEAARCREEQKRKNKEMVLKEANKVHQPADTDRLKTIQGKIREMATAEHSPSKALVSELVNSLTQSEVNSIVPSVIAAEVIMAETLTRAQTLADVVEIVVKLKDLLIELFGKSGVRRHKYLFIMESTRMAKAAGCPRISPACSLIEAIWDTLYLEGVVEEGYFVLWYEDTEDATPGRNEVLIQVSNWIAWLTSAFPTGDGEDREDYEESEEEEVDSHIKIRRTGLY